MTFEQEKGFVSWCIFWAKIEHKSWKMNLISRNLIWLRRKRVMKWDMMIVVNGCLLTVKWELVMHKKMPFFVRNCSWWDQLVINGLGFLRCLNGEDESRFYSKENEMYVFIILNHYPDSDNICRLVAHCVKKWSHGS